MGLLTVLFWSASVENTNHITNLIFMTPFISLIFIHTFLGEEIRLQTYAGLLLIISGIGMQKYGEIRKLNTLKNKSVKIQ
nr:hypothetical protein [Desulfobacula sp.]